jgi:hypothetical protein
MSNEHSYLNSNSRQSTNKNGLFKRFSLENFGNEENIYFHNYNKKDIIHMHKKRIGENKSNKERTNEIKFCFNNFYNQKITSNKNCHKSKNQSQNRSLTYNPYINYQKQNSQKVTNISQSKMNESQIYNQHMNVNNSNKRSIHNISNKISNDNNENVKKNKTLIFIDEQTSSKNNFYISDLNKNKGRDEQQLHYQRELNSYLNKKIGNFQQFKLEQKKQFEKSINNNIENKNSPIMTKFKCQITNIDNHPSSEIFKGFQFSLFGKFKVKQRDLKILIENRSGCVHDSVSMFVTHLIATSQIFKSSPSSRKINVAKQRNLPIIRQDYIHDCIKNNKLLSIENYVLTKKKTLSFEQEQNITRSNSIQNVNSKQQNLPIEQKKNIIQPNSMQDVNNEQQNLPIEQEQNIIHSNSTQGVNNEQQNLNLNSNKNELNNQNQESNQMKTINENNEKQKEMTTDNKTEMTQLIHLVMEIFIENITKTMTQEQINGIDPIKLNSMFQLFMKASISKLIKKYGLNFFMNENK